MSHTLKQNIIAEPSYWKAMLGFGWSIYTQNFWSYLIPGLLVSLAGMVPLVVIALWVIYNPRVDATNSLLGVFALIASVIFIATSFWVGVYNLAHTKRIVDGYSDVDGSVSLVSGSRGRILLTSLLYFVVLLVPILIFVFSLFAILSSLKAPWLMSSEGLFLSYIGAIITSLLLMRQSVYRFAAMMVTLDHPTIRYWKALKYSASLVQGRFWKVLGYFLLFILIVIGIMLIFSLIFGIIVGFVFDVYEIDVASMPPSLELVSQIIQQCVSIAFAPIFLTPFYVLYTKLDHEHQTKHHQSVE